MLYRFLEQLFPGAPLFDQHAEPHLGVLGVLQVLGLAVAGAPVYVAYVKGTGPARRPTLGRIKDRSAGVGEVVEDHPVLLTITDNIVHT